MNNTSEPIRIFREGRIFRVKEGLAISDLRDSGYFDRHPGAVVIDHMPSDSELNTWMNDCGCESIDGCWVEPDGTCEHGLPSWLLALRMI